MPNLPVLLSCQNLVIRRSNRLVLDGVSFVLQPQTCWTVVGPIGSGKTTFLEALAGRLPVLAGAVVRHTVTTFVSFREESRQFSYSGHFYQQRYHATMSDLAPTVRDFLQYTDSDDSAGLLRRLGLSSLLDLALLKLSNGQTRKVRIAKALLQQPAVLLLDNPFVGLDSQSRNELTVWLNERMKDGLSLMLVAAPDNIPSCTTHLLELEAGCIRWQGPLSEYRPTPIDTTYPLVPVLQTPAQPVDFTEAFSLHKVSVRYGDRVILDSVDWTVKASERWALLGPNGAGKSVLLSLLYGDHPQAYANDVRVFGHRRGRSGESIWDVKRRIGFVSPELHLYFPHHLTVRQVILTGLTGTLVVPARITSDTEFDLVQLLTYFGLDELISRSFGTLSAGEQRLVLLIRAILKNSPVLLLDEPFQVLDDHRIRLARRLLDSLPTSALLFITHDPAELPDTIQHTYRLPVKRSIQ